MRGQLRAKIWSQTFGCELDQRGKLLSEKSRLAEVFWSVYCKFLEQGLLFWVRRVPCTIGAWAWLRHQSITLMQIKFCGQYDSQWGVSAPSSLFIGCKVVELLDHDHRTRKIKGDHRKHRGKVNVTNRIANGPDTVPLYQSSDMAVGYGAFCRWVWVQPFSNKTATDFLLADRCLAGSLK